MYTILGVQHVAMGVRDLETMKAFYRDTLEATSVFAEFPEVEHEPMDEVVRSSNVYSAILCNHEAGGILFELVHMAQPEPRPLRRDFRYGDIGVAKTTVAVADLEQLYRERADKINFCSEPKRVTMPGLGDYRFVFCKDPEGNLIEFVSSEIVPVENGFGGACWVGVSVTDLERSMAFYRKHFGLERTTIDVHERFSGLVDEVSGGQSTRVRSCLLTTGTGGGMVELFEVTRPRGRSIPFASRWGDFGYLQFCLACDNTLEMAAYCEQEGIEFFTHPKTFNDDKAGSFIYVRDPDGIPVEFLGFN